MFPLQEQHARAQVKLDERRDDTGWQKGDMFYGARDWAGYSMYPPAGIDVRQEVLNVPDLFDALLADVSTLPSCVNI